MLATNRNTLCLLLRTQLSTIVPCGAAGAFPLGAALSAAPERATGARHLRPHLSRRRIPKWIYVYGCNTLHLRVLSSGQCNICNAVALLTGSAGRFRSGAASRCHRRADAGGRSGAGVTTLTQRPLDLARAWFFDKLVVSPTMAGGGLHDVDIAKPWPWDP